MSNKVSYIILFILIFKTLVLHAQDTSSYWKDHFEFNGYVKFMNTNQFADIDTIYTDNLIHNRINFNYTPVSSLSLSLELRNRAFWGESVKLIPFYADWIDEDYGEVDLSFNLVETPSFIMNTTIDRAYLEYYKGKWSFRAGRQRINWGINLAWNPNDLFNAYNFVDFDYQERPGSDAIRIQYFNKLMSQIELAFKPGEDLDNSIIAGMYKFNKNRYDIQFIGANYLTDIAIGTGWAGNLWNAGFKGEATYFHPKNNFTDTSGVVSASISLDYTFEKGAYLNLSGLYNGSGSSSADLAQLQTTFTSLNAKNLMPSEFAGFLQVAHSFTPIFGGGLSFMYIPSVNGLFFIPTLNYSIKENWDIDIVGQILYAEQQSKLKNLNNALFLRIRWSY